MNTEPNDEGRILSKWVVWLCDTEPIPVLKMQANDGSVVFRFYVKTPNLVALGITKDEVCRYIESFVVNKCRRTVLSEDIERFEIIDMDTDQPLP